MTEQQARRNIRLLRLYRLVAGSLIAMPVLTLFWQQNGLNQEQIALTQAVFAATAMICEVPSGWFADRFARKTSLAIGAALAIVGFAVYSMAYGFWQFCAAEVVLGVGYACVSGADSALACDSLLAAGIENNYSWFEATSMGVGSMGGALASLTGGVVAANFGLRSTVVAQVPLDVVLLVVALLLIEPPRLRSLHKRNIVRDVLRITKYALHGHREIKWLIFYGAVVGTMTHTVIWLYQPYYAMVGVPIGWFGVISAGQFVSIAVFSLLVTRYERMRRAAVLSSFVAIGVVSYVVMGLRPTAWLIGAQLGFHLVRALSDPIIKDYVNRLIEPEFRATLLSVKSLVQRLLYSVAGPAIGWVVDHYSLSAALLFSAVLYGSLGLVTLVALRRARVL